MAALLLGKVYYNDHFAGFLREEPGDRSSFTYDEAYVASKNPPLSYTLPLRSEPYMSESELPPFFDNLVAEGWLEEAQTRLLGKRQASRFELLLAFGRDCAGAVSIVDPLPSPLTKSLLNMDDPKEVAMITSRASLSGIQPKLPLVKRDDIFVPAHMNELSTHIAKFPSRNYDDIVINEYLTSCAFKALLPNEDVVEHTLGEVKGFSEKTLIIKRFDRTEPDSTEGQWRRLHFEEFNQLLGQHSRAKYNGSYKMMADFIRTTHDCLPAEVYRLYLRILVGLLLGNTDMHLKNFAMIHTPHGLRLAPCYDQVAGILYNYQSVALTIAGAPRLLLHKLKAIHLIKLGQEFNLKSRVIKMAIDELADHVDNAKEVIKNNKIGPDNLKRQLIKFMEKQWNQIFTSIGKTLLKKQ